MENTSLTLKNDYIKFRKIANLIFPTDVWHYNKWLKQVVLDQAFDPTSLGT